MAQVNFDISQRLDLNLRSGEYQTKSFSFLNTDGSDYDISALTFDVEFYRNEYFDTPLFSLSSGNGLTVSGNDLQMVVSADNSDLEPGSRFWKLLVTSNGNQQSWITGQANFREGVFDPGPEQNSITIDNNGSNVVVNISSGISPALTDLDSDLAEDFDLNVASSTFRVKGSRTQTSYEGDEIDDEWKFEVLPQGGVAIAADRQTNSSPSKSARISLSEGRIQFSKGTLAASDALEVSFVNLPTSSSGLVSGQLWNDNGVLKIV